jgi:hypothetical protein
MAVGNPSEVGLDTKALGTGSVGAGNATHTGAAGHQVENVTVCGGNLDPQGALVTLAVNDGALPLIEASTPSNVNDCPFHGFTLPDDGVDPWDYNYPEFNAAERNLKLSGYEVLNPARQGYGLTYDEYLKRAIADVFECDAIALLPGWEDSAGAKAEVALADALKKDASAAAYWMITGPMWNREEPIAAD